MSYTMTPLLDETDTRVRARQFVFLLFGSAATIAGMSLTIRGALGNVPRELIGGLVVMLAGVALFVVAGRYVQLFETSYKDHRIRFTNCPYTGERLYIDDKLVARGGLGFVLRLEGPIPSGGGAGDRIVATSEAGLQRFRVRIEATSSGSRL
jgi:hypothetical protein